jgi:hypothetical protein
MADHELNENIRELGIEGINVIIINYRNRWKVQ